VEKLKRPKITSGPTEKVSTGCGSIYITPNRDNEGRLVEVIAHLGKAGTCTHAQLEAITRAVTLGLRYGIPVEEYIDEFKEIKCPCKAWENGDQILSCADAIAKVLGNESRNYKPNPISK